MHLVRLLLGLLTLSGIVTLFVAPLGWLLLSLGLLTRIQLVPAVLAFDGAVLLGLLVFVLLFGRLYCSVICPLGVSQDVVRGIARMIFRQLPQTSLQKEGKTIRVVRWSVAVLFVLSIFFGLAGLIEPYGIFGRFVSIGILRSGSPAPLMLGWSIGLFALILLAGLWRARWWCSHICPVGTFLGLFAPFALIRVRIDHAACVNCNRCVKACDKGVISSEADKSLNVSRCVACFNCVGVCGKGALTFLPWKGSKKKV